MNPATERPRRIGSDFQRRRIFFGSLVALCLLPISPELWLWLHHYDDLRAFATAAYYELIVSFLLWLPVFALPRLLSRGFVIVLGTLIGLSTLVVGFQAVMMGARWDATAHIALLETHAGEAWEFARTFASFPAVACAVAAAGAFAACITLNVCAATPSRRQAAIAVAGALIFSAYGLRHAISYLRNPIHVAPTADGRSVRMLDLGQDGYHPLLQVLTTQWNVSATRAYRRDLRQQSATAATILAGATAVPGATPPCTLLFVIGESAGRRHWSLYGYSRPTNPRLASLGDGLVIFRDTICRTVGTVTEIRGMLSTPGALPIIGLFSGSGYKTAWLSTQFDQAADDLNNTAIAQACDRQAYFAGALDANLVPAVRREIATPGRHFIIVHLTGSHIRYEDRYPHEFAVFRGEGDKGRRIATYDNSIRYTDYVLSEFIRVLREASGPTCLLYASDHSEDVYDSDPANYRFRSDSVATDPMYEIPFVIWFSPEYQRLNPAVFAAAQVNSGKPFQTVALYQTLIDLARLRHPVFEPELSIVSPQFTVHPRFVGAMNRPYQSPAIVSHELPSAPTGDLVGRGAP